MIHISYIILIILLVGIITPNAIAEDIEIPLWIKNNAGWWATDQIDDITFLLGIEYLIKEEIMVIPPTETSGSSGSQEVPSWVKNNAGWWADGQIDDNSFVSGIQYLIKVGIIVVEQEQTPTPEPTELDTSTTSDFSVKKYTDQSKVSKLPRFNLEYPDDWVIIDAHPDAEVALTDQYDWRTWLQVFWNKGDILDNRSDSEVLREMEQDQWEGCTAEKFAVGVRNCTELEVITEDSGVFYTNDNRKVYFVKSAYTLEWSNYLVGQENSMIRTMGIIYDEDGEWELSTESFEHVFDNHYDKIIHIMKSFSFRD